MKYWIHHRSGQILAEGVNADTCRKILTNVGAGCEVWISPTSAIGATTGIYWLRDNPHFEREYCGKFESDKPTEEEIAETFFSLYTIAQFSGTIYGCPTPIVRKVLKYWNALTK